jgi:Ferredoxin-like domain in Api92-like protein
VPVAKQKANVTEVRTMPNWCECDLTIKGPKDELLKFRDFAKTNKSVLDHNRFVPYPDKFKRKDEEPVNGKDGFNSGGYEWCLTNWGTKWGICTPELTERKKSLLYGFECAWSPPVPLIRKMGEMFPALSFKLKYFEAGMAFQGVFEMREGHCSIDECKTYRGNRGG